MLSGRIVEMNAGLGTTLFITLAIQALVSAAALTVPVLAPVLGPELGVPAEYVGVYVSLLYMGAMFGSLSAGGWVLRIGAIRASQVGLSLCVVGLLATMTGIPAIVALGALIVGLGYGPMTPASSHLLAKTTPPHRMSFVFSVKQTGVPLGGVLAGVCVPKLDEWVGWQGALITVAVACVACIGMAELVRSDLDSDRRAGHPVGLGKLRESLALVFSKRPLAFMAGSSLTFSAVQMSLGAFLVTYLHDSLGYSLVAAGLMLSVAQVAGMSGRLLWGWVSDRFTGAVVMLFILAVLMAVGGFALAALPKGASEWLLAAILILFGATSVGWNGVYLAEVARQAPVGQAGMATGGSLACTFFGVVLGPPLFGVIASVAGSYRVAFVLIVIPALLLGILLLLQRRHFRQAGKLSDL